MNGDSKLVEVEIDGRITILRLSVVYDNLLKLSVRSLKNLNRKWVNSVEDSDLPQDKLLKLQTILRSAGIESEIVKTAFQFS